LPRILDLLNKGIVIATTIPEQIYTRERLEREPFCAVEILVTAIRASEENKARSVRSASRWDNKRANAGTTPLTGRLPHWLEVQGGKVSKGGKIAVRPDRARLVKLIFEQAANGVPTFRIAYNLNKQGIPSWGKARRKDAPSQWHRSYIHRILTNKAVIGEFQPRTGKERKPIGPVEPNYFPRIVSDVLFYTVFNQ